MQINNNVLNLCGNFLCGFFWKLKLGCWCYILDISLRPLLWICTSIAETPVCRIMHLAVHFFIIIHQWDFNISVQDEANARILNLIIYSFATVMIGQLMGHHLLNQLRIHKVPFFRYKTALCTNQLHSVISAQNNYYENVTVISCVSLRSDWNN